MKKIILCVVVIILGVIFFFSDINTYRTNDFLPVMTINGEKRSKAKCFGYSLLIFNGEHYDAGKKYKCFGYLQKEKIQKN